MGKRLDKKVAKIRRDLKVLDWYPVVAVDREELLEILDRLKKLEKRNKKRKAEPVEPESETVPDNDVIRKGDRVELVANLQTHLWPFMLRGARGTVEDIYAGGMNNHVVMMDDDPEKRRLGFDQNELRKVLKGDV